MSSLKSRATMEPPVPAGGAAGEATPWPLLCPTPDCNEHLRAHPHPSAPVLFAACGHSYCGLCAAVVLCEPLPQCPTCGVGVESDQAFPNTGLGQYGEAILSSCSNQPNAKFNPAWSTCTFSTALLQSSLVCAACKANEDLDEPATYVCSSGSCENKPLCCDHSRFHAKKTGHEPVCLEDASDDPATARVCPVHALPLTHYCMLHSELLCGVCVATRHLPCGAAHVEPVQKAADHCSASLSATAEMFATSAADMLRAIPVVTTARASMVSRLRASISQFSGKVDDVIAALHARRLQVITAANQKCAEYTKALDSQAEVMSVSATQLQAAAAFASASLSSCSPVCILEASATVKAMAALVQQYDGPVVVPVVEVRGDYGKLLEELRGLSWVVTGCGLKVASVAGFALLPGPRQELRVALCLEDGSAPSWLLDCDVECAVRGVPVMSTGFPSAVSDSAAVVPGNECSNQAGSDESVARVLSYRVSSAGNVTVAYELLRASVQVVALQLSVCGVTLSPACGWRAHRQRTLLNCEAVGKHVWTLSVVAGSRSGLAVSADEKWLVVGLYDACTLSVYSLPDGELVRTFGGSGSGPLQFKAMSKLCFAPNGHLLVVDHSNRRLQEVALEGGFVRYFGEGVWNGAFGAPWSVAVWKDVIAVGCANGTGARVTFLGFASGAVSSQFGEVGTESGQLSPICDAVRFTADGGHVVVAEREAKRLSVFSVGGAFVRCIGLTVETLSISCNDVCLSARGEYVVADRDTRRVCVFSADGCELVRAWGSQGTGNGQFEYPSALCIVGAHLYVLDRVIPRVQLFE